jgi:hypothetical protein
MNQAAQLAVVFAERKRGVKAGETAPAETADTSRIERGSIQESCPATGAEMLGYQRSRSLKTGRADGNT